jgi:hypothetical protein
MRFIILLLFAVACATQKQGVQGTVLWLEGNQMPGFGNSRTPPKGISREILFYEPTRMDQAKYADGLYSDIQTKLIAKATSNKTGEFEVTLPDGEYSVFIQEPEGLFANTFDGNGRINVIEVKKGVYSKIKIQVNYKAAF